ncbi:MAG: right-handed parallel beta-helix repeat-containing protein [Clostridia bacterium]|nr:right-handed parallel beta-helix repeat-containing protein [Clostridia bacterium]
MIKRLSCLLIVLIMLLSSFVSCGGTGSGDVTDETTNDMTPDVIPAGKTFYVSPDGDDENDGSESSPLASITGARDAIRAYRAESGLPDGGIAVIFSSGTYRINITTTFTAEDSGEDSKPIVYRAADGAEVIFSGGISLSADDFIPANDEIKSRVQDESAKAALLEIDLTKTDCYDLIERTDYGSGWGSDKYRQELYVDDIRQTLAQWPNGGAYETNGWLDSENSASHYYIPEEKYELWKDIEGIGFYGAPEIDWDMRRIFPGGVSIDNDRKTLVLTNQTFKPSKSSNLWVYNLVEEIDVPGEYYWDIDTGKLYYYPEGDLAGKKIVFSQFVDSFIALDGAKYVSFNGITFENARASVFSGRNHENGNITISKCLFRCLGVAALDFYGNNTVVSDNEFCQLGSAGIILHGGNEITLEPAESVIKNNLIHDYGQIYMVYQPGIKTDGVGFEISHNEIYNSPHFGIELASGNTVIEYNDIHDVCQHTSDTGAIYLGRRWDWSGNHIRYNYIHDNVDIMHGGGPSGIYLDDQVGDQRVYGNVVENTGGNGIIIGSGKYNVIENNILINCGGVPISNDQRGLGFASEHSKYPNGYMWGTLISLSPYSGFIKYMWPENMLQVELTSMSSIYRIDDPGICSYTTVRGNVAIGCISDALWADRDYGDIYKDTITVDGVVNMVPMARLYCTTEGNVYYPKETDIGFVDSENNNFALKDSSVVYRDIIGFEIIPFDKIGIEKN